MKTGISLRVKFSAILTGIIVLLGISIVWFVRTSVRNRLMAEMQKGARLIAQDIAFKSVDPILTKDIYALQSIAIDHTELHEDIFYVFITDPDGNILAHSFGMKFPADLMKPSIVANVGAGRITRLETNKGVAFDVSMPVLRGQAGAVHVGILGEPIEEKVTAILWQIILIITGILALGYILAMYFVSFIVKPLRELTHAAEALGRGDLTQRAQVAAHDETGVLAEAFNKMAEDLMRTTTSITNLNAEIAARKQAQAALKESEAKYRSLTDDVLESSELGLFILDVDFKVVWINQAIERFFGLQRDQVIGKDKRKLIRTQISSIFENPQEFIDKVISTYDNNTYVERFECHILSDGIREERWLEHRSLPIRSGLYAGGRMEHYIDITQRKKGEDLLKESEMNYRAIFNSVNEAIVVHDTPTGEMLEINSRFCTLFGYTAEEVRKLRVEDISSGNPPYSQTEVIQLIKSAAEGTPQVFEWICKDRQGRLFWAEVNLKLVVLRGHERILAVIRDISERKRAEEKIVDVARFPSENPGPILRIARDGTLLYANDASESILEEWGCREGEFVGDEWYRIISGVFETGEEKRIEREHAGRVLSFMIVPVIEVGYANLYCRDTTDRKHAEQERERLLKTLAAKNEELQSIVYVASHDLKSPLVNIQGFSGELSRTCEQIGEFLHGEEVPANIQKQLAPLLDEDIPESISFIRAGTVKMQALLNGLLEVCRVGSAALQIKALDMNKITKHIIESMQFQITDSGAELTVDDLPGCIGDPDHVNQVFSNLFANAVKYLDPDRKGKIHISGRVEDGESIYCVQDNGLGIAPQHQEKVFEIFHRLEPGGDVEGEGLGLTIALRIIERHEGRIWVESEPGKGSKFFVSLPTA